MSWKDALINGQEIVVSSASSEGLPHSIVVICQGIVDNKILFAACQTNTTLKNIRENKNVCIVTKMGKEYYRINGPAEIHSSGKYFDISLKRNGDEGPSVRFAITVDVEEVFDLDKVEKVI